MASCGILGSIVSKLAMARAKAAIAALFVSRGALDINDRERSAGWHGWACKGTHGVVVAATE